MDPAPWFRWTVYIFPGGKPAESQDAGILLMQSCSKSLFTIERKAFAIKESAYEIVQKGEAARNGREKSNCQGVDPCSRRCGKVFLAEAT